MFVGEYAVTSGYGTYGNLSAALGEASFMTGMERNSDLVVMAAYAPLFGNVNGLRWQPDLIYYNQTQAFGTPSYYVQKMFSQNRGDDVLPSSVVVTSNAASYLPSGTIGLGSWNTSVQYSNIVVTSNGMTLYQSDFVHQGTNGWGVFNGSWGTNNGTYQQTVQITDCYTTYLKNGSKSWENYTISLQTRKTVGAEGFLILFNVLDNYDWTWWNIGGWGKTLDGIEQMTGGSKSTYARVPQTIVPNTWYYVRIVVVGLRAQCYFGTNAVQAATNLVQDVTLPSPQAGLLVSSTYAKQEGQVIVKAVNPYSVPLATTVYLAGLNSIAPTATVIQLTSGSAADENSFAAPANVSPVTYYISKAGTNFTLTLPANSLSVIRLGADGINHYTNLSLQLPPLITNGFTVASTVLGRQLGTWANLTANTNHAIVWSSANTNVVTVDIAGKVTGVASGATSIIASYPALGLSATQAVQVVCFPTTLVHRYSFSESNGSTTAADSIGGPVWAGTLPNGGTFSGTGLLSFSSASQQFLNLPGGVLSNYAAATIEMWVTSISGATGSPPFVYLFAFGDTDGSGAGYDYILFNPNLARTTISGTDPGYYGERGGNLASSLGLTDNLHLACVFDSPAGVINVYTNGVLTTVLSGITYPLSMFGNGFAYVGRSLYTADAYLDWTINELRIYNGPLSAAEIAATDSMGPNQLLSTASPTARATTSGNLLALSWPLALAGYTVWMSTNLTLGNWTSMTGTPLIIGGQWQFAVPMTNMSPQFYRMQK